MSIAGTFVVDKANVGQAYTVADEGLIWARWHSDAVFLPLPLVLERGPAGIFRQHG